MGGDYAMKTLVRNLKKNNKGISLIEILATIAIITIIAAPLVNSFINSMDLNKEARLIQNGTAVAQDMAEVFKTLSLESLEKDYTDKGVQVTFDDSTGKYTFKDIKVSGANGEKFLATVELDPAVYDTVQTEKIQINGVELPVFSGLYGSDTVMLYRQYAGFDEQLKDLFAAKLTEQQVKDNRRKFTKSTNINIKCDYDSNTGNYSYSFNIEMTYVYDNDNTNSVTVSKSIKKIFKGEQIHSIYMIAPIFDLYTSNVGISGCSYSTDKINVTYTFTGNNAGDKHNVYFYIAEQEMHNIDNPEKLQRINPDNLYVNGKKYKDYIEHHLASETIKLYTNIGDSNYNLTYGEYNTGDSLYNMKINVRLEGKSETIATFSTTK